MLSIYWVILTASLALKWKVLHKLLYFQIPQAPLDEKVRGHRIKPQ